MVTLALLANTAVLVAAFVVGLTLRRGPRRRAVLAVALALGLCLFKVTLLRRPDLETRLFPWPDYVLFSGWLAPLGMLALGAMAGLVRMRRDWAFIAIGTLATLFYFGDYLDWLSGSAGRARRTGTQPAPGSGFRGVSSRRCWSRVRPPWPATSHGTAIGWP